jgi:hypothetical protein
MTWIIKHINTMKKTVKNYNFKFLINSTLNNKIENKNIELK